MHTYRALPCMHSEVTVLASAHQGASAGGAGFHQPFSYGCCGHVAHLSYLTASVLVAKNSPTSSFLQLPIFNKTPPSHFLPQSNPSSIITCTSGPKLGPLQVGSQSIGRSNRLAAHKPPTISSAPVKCLFIWLISAYPCLRVLRGHTHGEGAVGVSNRTPAETYQKMRKSFGR